MRQGMGSIVGGSTRDLDLRNRSSARANAHAMTLSPRAAPYSLDAPMVLRGGSEAIGNTVNARASAGTATRPTAWCSARRACLNTPLVRTCCSHDSVSVAAAPAPIRARWGLPAQQGRSDTRRSSKVLPLPAVPASAAAAAAAADAEMEVPYTSSGGLAVTVRKIRSLDELRQVAMLRADAYYAENQSRFVGSLKKKFVEQEVESLQQRTTITSRQGKPYSECLVAVDSSSGAVLACIDMRLPASLNGTQPHGVPQDDPSGCYLLNVVVREDVRGQGLGRGIMRAAMGRAVQLWGAGRLYTHVDATNEVAYGLYHSCGFEQHSTDAKYEAATKLGQTVLLCAPAAAAAAPPPPA
ncbi:hypothetical protein PLESTB_000837200 [Pleodorina starrii]|uniref:N-acetyltransferase domain-containing protein n=1 Tax=Pleodorina starrii TaxID=330485 RepID=A0A9W6F3E2_9CHLO|nr:hypothetical protein PLESTB_000837200 [Pleodorina starrii]GLC64472.1 hypothetical protein PLESTF_000169600 [Pleodorina starrii]